MKNLSIIFLIILFSLTAYSQKPSKKPSPTPPPEETTVLDESQEFQNARSQTSITDRIAALKKFTEDFPESANRTFALELIVSSRAELGDQKLRLSDNQSGIELFKTAVAEAPTPISDRLFTEIVLQFPTNLFYRGQREAAFETARLIEEKIEGNPQQLLSLAAFYLGTEYAAEAKRIAEKVIEIAPDSAAAYQTLGLANRINFDLTESTAAYTKALELDPASIISKRSLAEMKRATGKPDEAATLYREILEKDASDTAAQTGLVLSLFNADKKAEAESELAKAFEINPNNLFLMVGAAYWYAAHNEGAKAVELAQKAVDFEPRYTWAHIALARGLIQQKKPLEAEKTLLLARQYGNFPTLNYEIAAARLSAGFYREAADILKENFQIAKDGTLSANLGGRVRKEGQSFIEVLSNERRASIFEPVAADDPLMAGKLKSLLRFSRNLDATEFDETEISAAADEFVTGADSMKLHRGLYAANRLLEKRIALPKALELAEAAIGKVDVGLDITSPSAAVMADELYETRTIAAMRNELLVVPEIPKQTLSRILRGRIEELTGWALLQQNKPDTAATHFKRAISILPEKSAWWRSSKWRLGDALEANGKSKEALASYIESYDVENPSIAKYGVIESLYEKVNETKEGLEQIVGAKPSFTVKETVAQVEKPTPTPTPEPTPTPVRTPTNLKIPENVPIADEKQTENQLQSEVKPTPTPTPITETEVLKLPENVPTIKSETPPETNNEIVEITKISAQENLENPPIPSFKKPEEITLIPEPSPTPQSEITTNPEPTTSPTPEEIKQDETILPTVSETPAPTPETSTLSENSAVNTETPEKPVEQKQTEEITKPSENLTAERTKGSLFDPIVINVPKVERKPKPEQKPENKVENSENPQNLPTETKTDETVMPESEKNPSGDDSEKVNTRPRIVSESKTETDPAVIEPCKLKFNLNSVSILNDGGSLGLFVSFEGKGGDVKSVTVSSSSPKDVVAEFQSDIGVLTERAFYIIKSISSKTGIYTVIFDSNCGKKELTVTVR